MGMEDFSHRILLDPSEPRSRLYWLLEAPSPLRLMQCSVLLSDGRLWLCPVHTHILIINGNFRNIAIISPPPPKAVHTRYY